MKKYIITYGDEKCKNARKRFVKNALSLNIFDEVIEYTEKDISNELKESTIIKEKRGGGLWSWKPDVILTTLNKMQDGDYLVYCDAGCTVYNCKEWNLYWKHLENHDIIAQRIFQRTDKWTRKNILEYFKQYNAKNWTKCYQYQASIIIKATPFSRMFIKEWRALMIKHPEMIKDVTLEERKQESKKLIENRHDQAIYSSLIYKYLNNDKTKKLIYTQWEHLEDYDLFHRQAIRATRLRNGEKEKPSKLAIGIAKRMIKDYVLKPLFYFPLQTYYSSK